MKKIAQIIVLFFAACGALNAQEITIPISVSVLDDRKEGHVLLNYKVPEDGYYSFTIEGGLFPKKTCTIYYCEYVLQLRTENNTYTQETVNIGSQAQDGRVCGFATNEKNNRIGAVFQKGESVQLILLISKSDVNGKPHHPMTLSENSKVAVSQPGPVYSAR